MLRGFPCAEAVSPVHYGPRSPFALAPIESGWLHLLASVVRYQRHTSLLETCGGTGSWRDGCMYCVVVFDM